MKYIYLILALICLISCEKDDQFNTEENDWVDIEINKLESLILKDRPANNKWRPYKYNIRGFSTRSGNFESLGMRDFIGFSFRTDISPIEDTRNLGNRVIDISRFSKDYPAYFKSWKNSSHEAKVFSFTSFDDYNDKSEFTNEVTHGSDIKLFGFSLSHKHVYTSTFGQNEVV